LEYSTRLGWAAVEAVSQRQAGGGKVSGSEGIYKDLQKGNYQREKERKEQRNDRVEGGLWDFPSDERRGDTLSLNLSLVVASLIQVRSDFSTSFLSF
jgi:hypothetical protein